MKFSTKIVTSTDDNDVELLKGEKVLNEDKEKKEETLSKKDEKSFI